MHLAAIEAIWQLVVGELSESKGAMRFGCCGGAREWCCGKYGPKGFVDRRFWFWSGCLCANIRLIVPSGARKGSVMTGCEVLVGVGKHS